MKNKPKPAGGKMLIHAQGIGLTDETDIEQRAREVARIEDHPGVTAGDRQQAERELAGEDIPPPVDEDAVGVGSRSRDPSEPGSTPGRQIPDQESEDEQFAAERLVAEGVNEAEHDQMLAARRQRKS